MTWLNDLADELRCRHDQHLLRGLRPLDRCDRVVRYAGRELINFAGNDYLGLARHPRLIHAVTDAANRLGVGSGASRLVTGSLEIHAEVEARFAAFKHAEAALILPTGFTANLATLTALAGPDDLICMDKLNHASLIDAAAASGASVRVYPHRNLEKLERLLERATTESGTQPRRRLIVTDAVFSMDGDVADLRELIDLRDRYEAILITDEAHGTGVLGEKGAGLGEQAGVADRVDVTVSTASKALGGLGGVVTGPRVVIDTLVNHARAFIYSTGVPPTQVAAIGAALAVIEHEPERREKLVGVATLLRDRLREAGWSVASMRAGDPVTPIVPIVVGEPARALDLSHRLMDAGLLVPAIRPPTVPPGSSRLRVTLRCDHTAADVQRLVGVLGEAEI